MVWEHPTVTDIDTAMFAVTNLAQTFISAIGFAIGANYSVETLCDIEDGQTHFYAKESLPGFGADSETRPPGMYALAGKDPHSVCGH